MQSKGDFYKPAKVNLTDAQAKKIIRQEPVRVAASQIGVGPTVIMLHPENHAKLSKAKRAKRGVVLYMSAGEVLATVESDMEGTGIFNNLWKNLKSGYNWVKKNIVDSDIYQKGVKPLVRSGVNQLAGLAKTKAPQAGELIDMVVDKVGKETGAFGVKNKGKKYLTKKGNAMYLMDSATQGSSFRLN